MDKDKIVTCGLNEEEFQFVREALWDESIEIFQESSPMDSVMKHRAFALILNLDDATPEERDFIQGYYDEMIWFSETLIFIGEMKSHWNVTGQVFYALDLRTIVPDLRNILQAAYFKTRNNENFRQGLIRAFQLAREIRNRPGVTTERLSEEFSLPENLIDWYILLLQSASEFIDYDPETGGWHYLMQEPGSMEQRVRSELANQAMNNELEGYIKYKDNSSQLVELIDRELRKR